MAVFEFLYRSSEQMPVSTYLTRKNFAYVLLTLILGALGSGLWEWLMKPAIVSTSRLLFEITTLGLQGLQDGLYEDVARGNVDRSGLTLLSLAVGFASSVAIFPAMFIYVRRRRQLAGDTPKTKPHSTRLLGIAILYGLFFTTFMFLNFYRISFVTKAANHLDRLDRMAAPYIGAQKRLELGSRAAQIHDRGSYVAIEQEMQALLTAQGIRGPSFEAF